jgi:hypothetical protein
MAYKATIRAFEAAQRRVQRDAQKRFRELERQAKEHEKLTAIARAHLEVKTFENQVEVLLSVHKEQGRLWDWTGIAASLPGPCPQRHSYHEQKARQCAAVMRAEVREPSKLLLEQARSQDDQEFQNAIRVHSEQIAQLENRKSLAQRIRAGDHKAYTEALVELNPFAEISDLGSSIRFIVHTAKLAECVLKVNGRQAIPAEVKTLTSSGKLSVKPIPKGRFHEIYQDYICGCVLRVAREIFALLPLDSLLVTAAADSFDPLSGETTEQPVLSVFMPRAVVDQLDFDRLDPSDAIESFRHRGDFKASRKAEMFQQITPLTPEDLVQVSIEDMGFRDLLANIRKLREDLKIRSPQVTLHAADRTPPSTASL